MLAEMRHTEGSLFPCFFAEGGQAPSISLGRRI
jgi:hypothetical protein